MSTWLSLLSQSNSNHILVILMKAELVLNLNSSSLETYVFIDLVINKDKYGDLRCQFIGAPLPIHRKAKELSRNCRKITSSVVEQYLAEKYNQDAGVVAVEKFVNGKNYLYVFHRIWLKPQVFNFQGCLAYVFKFIWLFRATYLRTMFTRFSANIEYSFV